MKTSVNKKSYDCLIINHCCCIGIIIELLLALLLLMPPFRLFRFGGRHVLYHLISLNHSFYLLLLA